jgi:hypothetical protein
MLHGNDQSPDERSKSIRFFLKQIDPSKLAIIINKAYIIVINNDTHVHRLLDTHPNYTSLYVFACACWPNLCPYNKRKLVFRSRQCVFIGYSPRHKGVKCLKISRDVVFDEHVFPFKKLHSNAGALLQK